MPFIRDRNSVFNNNEPKLKVICQCNSCSKQLVCMYSEQIKNMAKILINNYVVRDTADGTIIPYISCGCYERAYDN